MNSQPLIDWLTSQMPEALEWLERMVRINSFTTNKEGVNVLGKLTADAFAELGFEPEFVPSTEPTHGSHLYLRRPGATGAQVLLVSHLDTVFPPEEELRENFQWEPVPEEGRIYGPGTVDIKGGTVLIWMILGALQRLAPKVFEETNWLIALNASEEVMSADFGVRTAERCPQGAKAVLVYEGGPVVGGDYHLVTSRKGRASYRITAHGKAAHAGSSHAEGINAIVGLADVVKAAAALTNYDDALTVNVGVIHGGTVTNRVPHEATAELEMRAFDPHVLKEAQTAVEALASEGDLSRSEPRIEVICEGDTPGWPNDERTQQLFQCWVDAAASLDHQVISVPRGGLSDANYLCHLGPTLDGLGPFGANAHCSERSADGTKVPEYVVLASFVPKAAINVLGILKLLGRESELEGA